VGVPVWSVGQVLSADDVNTWFVPVAVVKQDDQTVTSSTALANDDALFVTVAANAEYTFRCWIDYIGLAGVGLKWGWSVPSGTTMRYSCFHNEGGSTGYGNSHIVYGEGDTGLGEANSPTVTALDMKGDVTTSSTSGTLHFEWAQNNSNAQAMHIRHPSFIEMWRVS